MDYVEINCDVGEGVGNEAELLPLIGACNIACGGHAGDREQIQWILNLAKANKVKVGAHPSYPDRENFGRVSMHLSSAVFIDTVRNQTQALFDLCKEANVVPHHIKPHGALYNDLVHNEILAHQFLEAIEIYKGHVYLYVPPFSKIQKIAIENGFSIKLEAFADRNYNDDYSLVSRSEPNAVLAQPEKVLQHLLPILRNSQLYTVTGKVLNLTADTFCIHGDTPAALQILMYLTQELPNYNYQLKIE